MDLMTMASRQRTCPYFSPLTGLGNSLEPNTHSIIFQAQTCPSIFYMDPLSIILGEV